MIQNKGLKEEHKKNNRCIKQPQYSWNTNYLDMYE